MIMEWSKWRREIASAFVQSGYPIGVVIATIVNILFLTYMGPSSFNTYGWRIYMGTGAVIAVIAFVIRNRLLESPIWSKPRTNPLTLLFKHGGAQLGAQHTIHGRPTNNLLFHIPNILGFPEGNRRSEYNTSVMLISTIAAVMAVLLAGPLALVINYRWLIIGTLAISLAYAPIALILQPSLVNLVMLAFIENFAMGARTIRTDR